MQPAEIPEADRAAPVAPEIRPAAAWRVTSVEVLSATRLRVRFVDGTEGDVELRALLESPGVQGTVFAALTDPGLFGQVRVVLGALAWPNGADLAPDAMYDMIRAHGVWALEP